MKRYLVLVITMLVVLNLVNLQQVYAQDEFTVKFNDKQLEFDVKPYIKNGRTLVPFRKVLEAFGAEVSWDQEKQVVAAKKSTSEIYLKIGVDYAYLNGSKVSLDVSPEVSGGRTFVPLRFISENLGAEVNWESAIRTISITYNSSTYKLGQEGTYKDLKFSIDKIDTSVPGVMEVVGKFSFDPKDIVLEVSDDLGYVLPAEISAAGKTGDMNNIEGKLSLPTCHNFIGKYLVIKKANAQKELVKIAEYELS